MTNLGILVASARPNRVGEHVTQWVADAASGYDIDRIEIGRLGLPAFDEPHSPKAGVEPDQEHTRAWARRVAALDAAVIVTPQYNGSYPGALKNAIDFLYAEWNDLPVLLVGYGWGGAADVLAKLEELLAYVKADQVGSVGLAFREDLSVEGELTVGEEKAAALRAGLAAIAERTRQGASV